MSSPMVPAPDAIQYKIEVRLCGFVPEHDSEPGIIENDILAVKIPCGNISELEKGVLRYFGADTETHVLLWHLNAELCHIKRPFRDLFLRSRAGGLHVQGVCLHLHRVGVREGEDVVSAKIALQTSESDARHEGNEAQGGNSGGNRDGTTDGGSEHSNRDTAAGAERRRQSSSAADQSGDVSDHTAASELQLGYSQSSGEARRSSATPTDDPDQPESPTEADDTSAGANTATISIDWDGEAEALLGSARPEHYTYPIKVNLRLSGLQETIRQTIVDLLYYHGQHQHSLRLGEQVRFRTTTDRGDGSRLLDIDDLSYAARLSTVADFFDNPESTGRHLRATVSLIVEDVQGSMSPQKKRRTGKASVVEVDLDAAVRKFHDTPDHDLLRVGDVSSTRLEDPTDVAVEYPLIAQPHPVKEEAILLWETDGWDFGDSCIGGFALKKKPLNFSKTYLWWNHYQGVQNRKELVQRILKPMGSDPRLPFLPPLTMNVFDPTATTPHLGVSKIGSEDFNVAVRLVSHLPEQAAKESDLLDINMQIKLGNTDGQSHMLKAVERILRREIRDLFREDWEDRWNIELWILPHHPAPQKLFRFPTGRPGSSGLVREFVSQQMLDKEHRKLYMEAHIWPIGSPAPQLRRPSSSRSGTRSSKRRDSSEDDTAEEEQDAEPSGKDEDVDHGDDEEDVEGSDREDDADVQRTIEVSLREAEMAEEEDVERAMERSRRETDPDHQHTLELSDEEWTEMIVARMAAEREKQHEGRDLQLPI